MLAAMVPSAHAGMQIVGTRIVYPSQSREVTVNIKNTGTGSASMRLVQVWVGDGDPDATAESTKAPFTATPPVSRIDGGQGQSVRLMYTGGVPLPQDRESVFYFNMLEIPPKPETTDNYLQFAVLTRIKVFYRPENLPGDPIRAGEGLAWKVIRHGDGYALECTNPAVFSVSIANARIEDAGRVVDSSAEGGLCPPKDRGVFPLKGREATSGTKVVFDMINDYGVPVVKEGPLSR